MMGACYLSTRNEVTDGAPIISSSIPFVATAPSDLLRATPVGFRATTTRLGTDADPWVLTMSWPTPITVGYIGLINTNLAQDAKFRVEAWWDGGMTEKVVDTIRADGTYPSVIPPLYDPATLPFGEPNQFRGDIDPRDFGLYSTDAHAVPDSRRARVVRWTIRGGAYRADGSADTVYRVGLAWVGSGIAFWRSVGSGEGDKPGDQLVTHDDGSVWSESGVNKRTASIQLDYLDPAERDLFLDAVRRVGKTKPLVWLPDVDNPYHCFCYGGLFRRADDYSHKFTTGRHVSSAINLVGYTE